jgi:7-carboxy-7-deazaguanine synthase
VISSSAPPGAEKDLKVSELFTSLQGEGPSAGEPATFLRLAGCNLRCTWCDTEYSWNWERFSKHEQVTTRSIDALALELAGAPRLIITGGEPLLQQAALATLLQRLPRGLYVEVETNGTVVPSAALLSRVNQWNVSPKLANAGEPEARRLNEQALTALKGGQSAWLKFVIEGEQDLEEITALLNRLSWPRERVCFQAQARDRESLERAAPWVAALCQQGGYRYSPRLHLQLWGGQRGR